MPPKTRKSAAPAPAAVAETQPAITPEEAKKLAKLLKTSDRGKRLDAIRVVSENHAYIASGGCLLPLLESIVPKKKMEEVVKAAVQVMSEGYPSLAPPHLPPPTYLLLTRRHGSLDSECNAHPHACKP